MMYTFEEDRPLEDLLAEFIKALVASPEEVEIEVVETANTTILTISVVPDDVGKIIGRNGVIIDAIKTIFNALGWKQRRKVLVEIST